MDPETMMNFLHLLNEGGKAAGQVGQNYDRIVQLAARTWGVDELQAGQMLNSGMQAFQRQLDSTTGAYSDSDAYGRIKAVAKGMGLNQGSTASKFMGRFREGMGAQVEDLGNRANVIAGAGDLMGRGMGSAMANYGDQSDPIVQYLRYLGGRGNAPGTAVD